jgi:hypothetical protein
MSAAATTPGAFYSWNDSDQSVILTSLLVPIGRLMLENGLGIGDLIQAAKQAYVRAAIAQVVRPGERINASRLSVALEVAQVDFGADLGVRSEVVFAGHPVQ